jgi:predicted phage-related endonuclease
MLRFKWKFVERDEELISMLIQLEAEFWNLVQSNVPPALDGSDASAKFLSERFPNSVPKSSIDLPEEAAALIQQYEAASEKAGQYTEQKQEAENLLKQMMGDNETGSVGSRVITWKSVTQERLDSKTLKSERPAIYRKYANKTSYRRFSIKAAS